MHSQIQSKSDWYKPLVVLESPYSGRVSLHVEYAKVCLLNSLCRGEAPIASHLLWTQTGLLDDNLTDERLLGIAAGLVWTAAADMVVFYTDLGWSKGMMQAASTAEEARLPILIRRLY